MTPQCPICVTDLSDMADPVTMGCMAQHAFCFKCILRHLTTVHDGVLKSECPVCRGSDGSIILPKKYGGSSALEGSPGEFESTKYFVGTLPLIYLIAGLNYRPSCVIDPGLLRFYVANRKQLELCRAVEGPKEDIIKVMKWNCLGLSGGSSPNSPSPSSSQQPTGDNYERADLSTVIMHMLLDTFEGRPMGQGLSYSPGMGLRVVRERP